MTRSCTQLCESMVGVLKEYTGDFDLMQLAINQRSKEGARKLAVQQRKDAERTLSDLMMRFHQSTSGATVADILLQPKVPKSKKDFSALSKEFGYLGFDRPTFEEGRLVFRAFGGGSCASKVVVCAFEI